MTLSTVEDIQAGFDGMPCKNADRLNAAKTLFERAGAPPSAISVEKFKDAENLLIRHEGRSDDIIVFGAHYDFVDKGCGAVDNWSGIVALVHLYKTIRQFAVEKDVIFVAFGNEEIGLLGSRAMAGTVPPKQRAQYCAMINIDSFGMASPMILTPISSEALIDAAKAAAKELNTPLANVRIQSADSDSTSFKSVQIPAITLSGLTEKWQSVLHTKADQIDRVIPLSVYTGYRLALSLWMKVEKAPCKAFR